MFKVKFDMKKNYLCKLIILFGCFALSGCEFGKKENSTNENPNIQILPQPDPEPTPDPEPEPQPFDKYDGTYNFDHLEIEVLATEAKTTYAIGETYYYFSFIPIIFDENSVVATIAEYNFSFDVEFGSFYSLHGTGTLEDFTTYIEVSLDSPANFATFNEPSQISLLKLDVLKEEDTYLLFNLQNKTERYTFYLKLDVTLPED